MNTWPFYNGRKHRARLVNGVGIVINDQEQIVSVFVVEPFEMIAGEIDLARIVQPRFVSPKASS